ncbi:MAG: methyltransferase domain-containing protein, partial [Eubacteriales bacterium]|nr:methyltransferase domain-containing protein [Eubacteriales bacterium]
RFLDIGCGKGVVLREAARYPFVQVDGIELQAELVHTACQNFRILHLSGRVRCIQADAAEFSGYDHYDTFFLFNPFGEEILCRVAEKLAACAQQKPLTVIYHNPRYLHVFERIEGFLILRRLHDPAKDYDTCIFRLGKGLDVTNS